MGASDEGGIERDDIHEHPEAEFFLEKPASDFELREFKGRIEEKFDGIVARFAVDIDGAGEVGGNGVIQPIIIRKPGIFGGDGDEIAGAAVIDPEFLYARRFEDSRHTSGF